MAWHTKTKTIEVCQWFPTGQPHVSNDLPTTEGANLKKFKLSKNLADITLLKLIRLESMMSTGYLAQIFLQWVRVRTGELCAQQFLLQLVSYRLPNPSVAQRREGCWAASYAGATCWETSWLWMSLRSLLHQPSRRTSSKFSIISNLTRRELSQVPGL